MTTSENIARFMVKPGSRTARWGQQSITDTSGGLPQPHLDSPIFLATVLVVIGGDWQILPVSIYLRWCYASHLQLFGDGVRAVLRKCNIPASVASVVGETKNQETPLLIRWICKQFY